MYANLGTNEAAFRASWSDNACPPLSNQEGVCLCLMLWSGGSAEAGVSTVHHTRDLTLSLHCGSQSPRQELQFCTVILCIKIHVKQTVQCANQMASNSSTVTHRPFLPDQGVWSEYQCFLHENGIRLWKICLPDRGVNKKNFTHVLKNISKLEIGNWIQCQRMLRLALF
jgi:hypothetical protein